MNEVKQAQPVDQKKVNEFLDKLRKRWNHEMFGAISIIRNEFNLTHKEAEKAFWEWVG
jgi:hypothetical protein